MKTHLKSSLASKPLWRSLICPDQADRFCRRVSLVLRLFRQSLGDGGSFSEGGCRTAAFAAALLMASVAHAQFTSDYQTNTITSANSMNWGSTNYYVGASNANNGNVTNFSFDVLQVTNNGVLANNGGGLGWSSNSQNNLAVVSGGGSVWSNAADVIVGHYGANNTLIVTNGGRVVSSASGYMGNFASATNNTVYVSGTGSVWKSTTGLYVGNNGSGNQLFINNGGVVANGGGYLGFTSNSQNNLVKVSGAGSIWSNVGDSIVGNFGANNTLIITNGGQVVNGNYRFYLGNNASSTNNTVYVSGTGSVWSMGSSLNMGQVGGGNQMFINDGGLVVDTIGYVGRDNTGSGGTNVVCVSDPGSVWSNTIALTVGFTASVGNQLFITNGGSVFSVGAVTVGAGAGGNRNAIRIESGGLLDAGSLVTGAGSSTANSITNFGGIFQFSASAPVITPNPANSIVLTNGTIAFRGITNANVMGSFVAGSSIGNITFQGNNTFRLNNASNTFAATSQNYTFDNILGPSNYFRLEMINGGTAWRSAWLNLGTNGQMLVSNTVANIDGVLTNFGQITVANASATWQSNVVLSGGSSYLSQNSANTFTNIVVASGASFLADAASPVTVNGLYQNQGSSVFSNLLTVVTGGSYVGSGTTNQFAGLTIQSGGAFLFNSVTSTVRGVVTNEGTISSTQSVVTFQAPVVISGGLIADPTTYIFATNATVTPSGYLSGGSNDQFVFYSDFVNQSTNRSQFNLVQSAVIFTNGNGAGATNHLFNLAGSAALDVGSNILNIASMYTNFGIGTLSIASNNNLTVTGTKTGSLTNALYVGWLDLQALEGAGIAATNNYTALTNGIFAALTLPNVNLYYDKNLSANAYLDGLTYDLWGAGGGLLIPIPEPNALMLTLAASVLSVFILRRKKG